MKQNYLIKKVGSILLLVLVFACVEPIEIESQTYEDTLVVEAIITDQLEYQEVQLRRTFSLEESGPVQERNAAVIVRSENDIYEFTETEPGQYVSIEPFQALEGRSYTVEITSKDGRTYYSESEQLPQRAELKELYAERSMYEGEDGVAILVDLEGSESTSGYYKYDYTETYKIISPFSFPADLIIRNGEFIEIPKTKEEKTCYVTQESSDILLANTSFQAGNDVDGFLVKFMNSRNFKTAYRYSILVRQYSLSSEAFSFYETLEDFSDSESLFSQNQLGLISGNIISETDSNEKVIGYFAIAGVSSKRIFFDFEDIYEPFEFSPASHVECEVEIPDMTPQALPVLGEKLDNGILKYIGFSMVSVEGGTGTKKVHRFTKAECVDCTLFGENVAPDFWEE